MKGLSLLSLLVLLACQGRTQQNPISVSEVKRIESVLAADDMRGRRAGTPDIDRAASFIADEFKKAGLQPLAGNDFLQKFDMIRPRFKSLKASIGDQDFDTKKVIVITTEA